MVWIDWGTAPAWFGAFFTSLGVLVAVFIYWRDSRRSRFAQSQQIRIEATQGLDLAPDGTELPLRVRVVNQSDKSIFKLAADLEARSLESVGAHLVKEILLRQRALTSQELQAALTRWKRLRNEKKSAPSGGWLKPGQHHDFYFHSHLGGIGFATVTFEDSLGVLWVCHLSENSYNFDDRRRVSHREVKRFIRRLEREQRRGLSAEPSVLREFQKAKGELDAWIRDHEGDRGGV